ncbi:MAG: putative amicyanin protein, partial [Alphaproteobacteria bacterium]|nr:putative amicyanin protein [Alphaproteobacteria bacterium]
MKFGAVPEEIRRGDTILWINRDMFRHNATAADRSFDLDLPPGRSARIRVARAGAFMFACRYHPG